MSGCECFYWEGGQESNKRRHKERLESKKYGCFHWHHTHIHMDNCITDKHTHWVDTTLKMEICPLFITLLYSVIKRPGRMSIFCSYVDWKHQEVPSLGFCRDVLCVGQFETVASIVSIAGYSSRFVSQHKKVGSESTSAMNSQGSCDLPSPTRK